ncbi:anaerobic glycerol-3-phosphate dehydrogenase subunit C [Endozoicomonas sp. OPT23]|uniref:anaerobic glycerol-3-phosphate dehydrogenase subunit GlpC n=1 Tax=Endozoicomonas sp. OPT23 TaxID=2072845 RepID=UPI00129A5EDA|nr:anaerobic glycerol-3-phosphate dehydrogenase subunit GlpC [Endozoicomonas sp. OPT23]MRI32710.1 anaerobic glycerol-3-phosphate dehydrogenase subunit C [Endozoicomonas sp. OPT23]
MSVNLALLDTSFDMCIKCTVCTTKCPVAEVQPDYPGPKQSGPDGERWRIKGEGFYDESLKYCTNCKRCEVACPSGVEIGSIIQKAKVRSGRHKPKIRDYILSHTDLMGAVATPVAPVVNMVTKVKPVRKLMDKVLDIDERPALPTYSWQTFRQWFKKDAPDQTGFKRQITFYHGCYINSNDTTVGKDLVKVLNAMNIGVQLLKKEKCCGVPLIANGFMDKAQSNAKLNTEQFREALEGDSECVISTSSSCSMTIRDEYHKLLEVDNRELVDRIFFFNTFLVKEFEQGNLPEMKPVKIKIAYHSPCHLIRVGGIVFTLEILRRIPGVELHMLDQRCCGQAGTYGFKKENYETSQEIGAPIFDQINKINPDFVVTDCEACKMQVESSTDYKVLHPLSVLARAL